MSEEITPSAEDLRDLEIARRMIAAGVAVFAAPPDPDRPGEYYLPHHWPKTVPSLVNLEKWKPGWALAAIGGRVADFLDADPRNGSEASLKELESAGQLPMTFGRSRTPSGGTHDVIAATGERKATNFMPGLDLQSGAPNGEGRGFVWIAPTVRRSKDPADGGALKRYHWEAEPDFEALDEYGETARESTEWIVARVHAKRAAPAARTASAPGSLTGGMAGLFGEDPFLDSSTANAPGGALFGDRAFTLAEAQEFLRPHLMALQQAQIGGIEDACNTAAAALSHFVPTFWPVDVAMAILETNLAETAYDPTGPSRWTVEKFRPVLDGRRPPLDPWRATVREEAPSVPVTAVDVEPGEEMMTTLQRLRSKLVSAEELALRPAPEPLVWGLLNRNTETWMIGAPGSLKSFIALDLAAAVGAGREWHGHRTEKTNVLYVAAEGESGMVLRTRAYISKHGGMPGVTLLPYPVQIKSADGQWAALEEIVKELNAGFVVIDTQHRVSTGLEENSATDMGVMVAAVGRLKRATKACVLVVHHTGRNGGDARGSSAIDGAQDTELKIVRATDGKRPLLQCRVVQDKQKDMAQDSGEPLALDLEVVDLGQDEHGRPISSLVVSGVADPFSKTEGFTATDAEPWRGQQPEDWTIIEGHVPSNATVARRILQVLADHGHLTGLTERGIREMVTERWEEPSRSGFTAAVQKIKDIDGLVVQGQSGTRWTIDQVELRRLREA